VILAGLLLASLFAASALTKVRMDRRMGMGTSPVTLVEVFAALAVAAVPMLSGVLPAGLVGGAVAVSVVASWVQFRRYRAVRRRREASEGGRLAAYVRYLSAADESADVDPTDEEAGPGGATSPPS
jgi:O-antigen/teichoic acid export membrane protein